MEISIKPIRLLPSDLIEKIAAGEVIERPSSVLKELFENAVDAGASRIEITIEDAGFSLIKVADNGHGMSAEDLTLSIIRHATSKIRSLDDLFSIRTMGFRGEALASIAAVSRVEIQSSDVTDGTGAVLSINGSEEPFTIGQSARPRGTTVTIRDLFFNTPARKKFMKSRKAERMHVTGLVEQLAIAYPEIHLILVVEGKPEIDVPATADCRERIAQIAGTEFAKSLIPCTTAAGDMSVSIYISHPERATPRPRYQCLFVNKRRIDNESVTFAVRNAFRLFINGSLKPCFFCFIDISPDRIDVNVHPTKRIVRFDDEQHLFGIIYHAVEKGLRNALPGKNDFSNSQNSQDGEHAPFPSVFSNDTVKPFYGQVDHNGTTTEIMPENGAGSSQTSLVLSGPWPSLPAADNEKDIDESGARSVQLPTKTDRSEHWELISCFQVHDLFIMAPIKNGILLIDQHAAHERILYEQAMINLKVGSAESQQLLFPIVVELSPTEKPVVMSNLAYFTAFGYEIQDFGGNTVSVAAMPTILRSSQVAEAVRDTIRFLLQEQATKLFPEPQRRFAAAFACGSAVKAGQKLTQEEMNALLNSLFTTENPYTCPHGRPTLIRISIDEIRRRFLR